MKSKAGRKILEKRGVQPQHSLDWGWEGEEWGLMAGAMSMHSDTRDSTDTKGGFPVVKGFRGWYRRTSSCGRGFLMLALV